MLIVQSCNFFHFFLSFPDPKFSAPITNVTAAVGREAVLTCQVLDLGTYKVSHSHLISLVITHHQMRQQAALLALLRCKSKNYLTKLWILRTAMEFSFLNQHEKFSFIVSWRFSSSYVNIKTSANFMLNYSFSFHIFLF